MNMEEQNQNTERQRQTAYKVWIADLMNNEYAVQNGWQPNYTIISEKKISRVNVIASVVSVYINDDKTYYSVAIDDGTGNISLKTWGEDIKLLSALKIGDLILVIGKLRQTNDLMYLTPEIVKVLNDKKWMLVRKLELEKLWPEKERKQEGQISQASQMNEKISKENKKRDEPVEEVVE